MKRLRIHFGITCTCLSEVLEMESTFQMFRNMINFLTVQSLVFEHFLWYVRFLHKSICEQEEKYRNEVQRCSTIISIMSLEFYIVSEQGGISKHGPNIALCRHGTHTRKDFTEVALDSRQPPTMAEIWFSTCKYKTGQSGPSNCHYKKLFNQWRNHFVAD
jgi:hypothetical protein